MNIDPIFPNFEKWSETDDYFQRVSDFLQAFANYFGTGLKSLDKIPDIFLDIWHWASLTFSFLPDYFISILTWFLIACMIIRFLRW